LKINFDLIFFKKVGYFSFIMWGIFRLTKTRGVPQVLEEEIIGCCKKLRLSRNLADMSQTTEGESHQEYLYKLLSAELKKP